MTTVLRPKCEDLTPLLYVPCAQQYQGPHGVSHMARVLPFDTSQKHHAVGAGESLCACNQTATEPTEFPRIPVVLPTIGNLT